MGRAGRRRIAGRRVSGRGADEGAGDASVLRHRRPVPVRAARVAVPGVPDRGPDVGVARRALRRGPGASARRRPDRRARAAVGARAHGGAGVRTGAGGRRGAGPRANAGDHADPRARPDAGAGVRRSGPDQARAGAVQHPGLNRVAMPCPVRRNLGVLIPGLLSVVLSVAAPGCAKKQIRAARDSSTAAYRNHLVTVPAGSETPEQAAQTAALRAKLLEDEWVARGYRVGNEKGGDKVFYSASGRGVLSVLWAPFKLL